MSTPSIEHPLRMSAPFGIHFLNERPGKEIEVSSDEEIDEFEGISWLIDLK